MELVLIPLAVGLGCGIALYRMLRSASVPEEPWRQAARELGGDRMAIRAGLGCRTRSLPSVRRWLHIAGRATGMVHSCG